MTNNRLILAGLFGATAIGFGGVGCEDRGTTTPPPAPKPTATMPPAADNTARNASDRDGVKPTPTDQGESEADRTITASIRKAIIGTADMSINAQNCKVITKDGVVTLRGPVATQAEKDTIEATAKAVAGVASVVNELEVKKS